MDKLLEISNNELETIITNTAEQLKMSNAIVEKDLWVCMILKYLFSKFKLRDAIVFKGGTSLSKVYKVIERFSEDIDLALDWRILGYGGTELYEERSNTKQQQFNNQINKDTKVFLCDEFLPTIQNDFKTIIKNKTYSFYIDEVDGQTICFDYPKSYNDTSILQVIRLEIGHLAESIPTSNKKIKTYIEEVYPELFHEDISVVVVDCLRTFYEKITIIHREANRVNGNYPARYSRHFYDVYKMIHTDIREKSLRNTALLKRVISFKKKFYTCNWAHYDDILKGNLKLIPSKEGLEKFSKDYEKMKSMIFGEKPSFGQIVDALREYEKEFNYATISKL